MRVDPAHDGVEIMERLGFNRGRPVHDDDFNAERARRLDLGIGRASAAVLRDQRLDSLVAHKRDFVTERERPALKDQLAVRQGVDLRGPIDRPHDITMLGRSREGCELQPAVREEDRSRAGSESVDCIIHGRDLDPAIVGLSGPGWAAQNDERRIGRSASCNRVCGHARSERMGCVDNGAYALADKKCGQAIGAAEAADALGNWHLSRIGCRPRQRQDWRNIGRAGKPPSDGAGFQRAAENEQTKTVQWAAP